MRHTEALERRGSGSETDPWMRYSWLMAALWLVFIFYPVAALVTSTAGEGDRVLGWIGLAVFVAGYLVSFRLGGNVGVTGEPARVHTWLFFALSVVTAAATIPATGDGAASFLPFIVTMAAYQLPRWFFITAAALSVLGLLAYMGFTGAWEDNIALLIILMVLCMVHFVSGWLIRRSIHADRLSHELVASEERESVARDVHDLLGHSLTVVKLKAQLARRLVRVDPDRAEQELDEIERLTGEAISGVRATVTGLRSEGLAAQLVASKDALGDAGTDVEVVGEGSQLSAAQSLVAAWILREATTNTLRHSGASKVRVAFRPGEFVFEDNGVGFPNRDGGDDGNAETGGGEGNGLAGMAERASVSGGKLRLARSADLGGARVELTW